MPKPKKQVKRYRVMRINLTTTLNPTPIEDWLNEADEEHFIHDVIKENNVLLIIMAKRCRTRYRGRRSPTKITKAAKKKTATKKTVVKKK